MTSEKPSKGILSWLGKAVTVALDPDKEPRLQEYVNLVDAEVARLRQAFDFSQASAQFGIDPRDQPLVAERLYRRFLERSWKDQQVTDRERELLAWIAGALGLPNDRAESLGQEFATAMFRRALSQAMSDGRVDQSERARLEAIAKDCGQTLSGLVLRFFKAEGEPLLRNVFSGFATDGRLDEWEWRAFQETV